MKLCTVCLCSIVRSRSGGERNKGSNEIIYPGINRKFWGMGVAMCLVSLYCWVLIRIVTYPVYHNPPFFFDPRPVTRTDRIWDPDPVISTVLLSCQSGTLTNSVFQVDCGKWLRVWPKRNVICSILNQFSRCHLHDWKPTLLAFVNDRAGGANMQALNHIS